MRPPTLPPVRSLSAAGLAELKAHELCRLKAYPDRGGVWTIGWGDTIKVKEGDTCTQLQADARLVARLAEHESALRKVLQRDPTQGQYDALVSVSYNIGSAGLGTSTLMRLFNAGDTIGAAKQFARWVHVKGKVDEVLIQRRIDELCRYFA
jgi:lysozyme